MPGSWVWNGFGGVLASNPYQIIDNQGMDHAFVKGSDNGLYENIEGDWRGLGGVLTSDPVAVKDAQGNIHVLVKGTDDALWQHVSGSGWSSLGGILTSSPSASLKPDDNHLKIAVRGSDNAVYVKDITAGSDWSSLGGIAISNPQVIFDVQNQMHVLVKGSDGALYDNINGNWQYLGGIITSDAKPVVNPFDPGYIYTFVRGTDGGLYSNKLDINSKASTWQGLGGIISQDAGSLYEGNPAPVVDTDGVIHSFVRGIDAALYDNVGGNWHYVGGILSSDPNAVRDRDGRLRVAVRGIDNALYINNIGINQAPTSLIGPIASDYDKIQPAIDAASPGRVIRVAPGIYNENVLIDKSLIVKGAGADKTIVDGKQAGSVFTIGKNSPNVDVTLSGMTITGGTGTPILDPSGGITSSGGGIFNNGTTTLTNCIVSGNTAHRGGGIMNYGNVNLNGDSITRNTAFDGGGINNYIGTMNMNSGSITENTANEYGGGIYSYNSQATFDGTQAVVKSNKAHLPGSELSWYQGWGIAMIGCYCHTTTTGGFNPAIQVTDNTKI